MASGRRSDRSTRGGRYLRGPTADERVLARSIILMR